jgi:hypothetical protein
MATDFVRPILASFFSRFLIRYRGLEFFGAVYNFTDSRDPNVGTLLPIFRPELGRTFRVGMRFTWAQERR